MSFCFFDVHDFDSSSSAAIRGLAFSKTGRERFGSWRTPTSASDVALHRISRQPQLAGNTTGTLPFYQDLVTDCEIPGQS